MYVNAQKVGEPIKRKVNSVPGGTGRCRREKWINSYLGHLLCVPNHRESNFIELFFHSCILTRYVPTFLFIESTEYYGYD